jgi:hypothetical protein
VLLGDRHQVLPDRCDLVGRELEAPVEGRNLDLNLVNAIVAGATGAAVAGPPSGTAELLVDAAVASMLAVDQAGSAKGRR